MASANWLKMNNQKAGAMTIHMITVWNDNRGNPEPRPAQEEKHGFDTNKLALTTIADAEPTMRKRVTIFRTLSIGIGYQAQTVVRTQIDRYYNQ